MASLFVPKARHVLPNLRRFVDTVALGELRPAIVRPDRQLQVDFETLLSSWKESPSVGVAGDLIGSALVSGNHAPKEIGDAARFVINRPSEASRPLVAAAQRLLTSDSQPQISDQLPRLSSFLETHSRARINDRIHELRLAATRFGGDPILFTELARLYMIVGHSERAKRNIRIALSLAPTNRFVLRSAARLFSHFDDAEQAYDLLRRSPATRHDPWLLSAELAVAGLVGNETRVAKRAAAALASKNYSPFSLTELGAGLGSIELLQGDRKRSRRLLQSALAEPNDNALAQTEWALSVDRLFDFDATTFNVKRNHEAVALDAFNRADWLSVIQNCETWFMDMPFSRRPVMMASHVATVALEDYAAAQMFCQAALVAHPRDPSVLNNYAYALALDGKADEALALLDEVPIGAISDPAARTCLLATRGLAMFRNGRIEEGRALYAQSFDAATGVADLGFRQTALLNYVREELLSGHTIPPEVIETVRKTKVDSKASLLLLLKDKVLELHERAASGQSIGPADGSRPGLPGSTEGFRPVAQAQTNAFDAGDSGRDEH
jgi:Tfp pilus assembly protein PilF